MPNPLSTTLPLLIAATVLCYVGTRLLWMGFGGQGTSRPLMRGIALSLLLTVLAGWMTFKGDGSGGVALLFTGSVIMMTLGLGLAAMGRATNDGIASPSLRALPPMCAAVCLVGFSGALSIEHALMLVVLGGVLVWMLVPGDTDARPLAMKPLQGGALVTLIGIAFMIWAASRLIDTPVWPITGPVFVLLVLLSTVGLLAGDALAPPESPIDTVVGYILGALGFGLPLLIVLAHLLPHDIARSVATTLPATLPATTMATTAATTQPAGPAAPAIVMPLVSWRIDSVLLTALSIFLIPVGIRRVTLGRFEGALLVLASLFYVTVSVGAMRFR